jgi:hypothetical protein
MMQLLRIGYSGRYRIKKVRAGQVTFDSGWFSNLITDSGLDQIANIPLGTGGIPYLITQGYVGTGDTPPAVTDTFLSSYLASSDTFEAGGTNSFIDGMPPYWRHVRVFTFAAGTVTGALREVGVGNTKDTLFSRALIVNTEGTVQTVEVLADEGIQLSYELRAYINSSDVVFNATLPGNTSGSDITHTFTVRPANISVAKSINIGIGYSHNNIALYSGVIQGINQIPLGSATSLTSYVNIDTYVPGSFSTSFSLIFYESTGSYTEGVKAIRVSNQQCDFQIGVVPPIMKTSRYILTLTAYISWGRYTP